MRVLNWVNRTLASTIATLNAVLAVGIVLLSAFGVATFLSFEAYEAGAKIGLGVLGFILGIIPGAVLAIFFCGILALLIDIRQVLIEIRDQARNQTR